jgi:hypothetical protein
MWLLSLSKYTTARRPKSYSLFRYVANATSWSKYYVITIQFVTSTWPLHLM